MPESQVLQQRLEQAYQCAVQDYLKHCASSQKIAEPIVDWLQSNKCSGTFFILTSNDV